MNSKVKSLSIGALMMAAVFVVTTYIQVPIPLGYFNVGNSVIILFCLFFRHPYAIVASSLGSGLADLLTYPVYTIPTVLIKAAFPLLFFFLLKKLKGRKLSVIIAAAVSTLIPLFGYTLTGAFLYGGLAAGIAQFPGLLLEYAANLVIIAALSEPVKRIGRL
ncbi:MAG: ECF transporter S component [Lachnospiraceae bacterium]|nr:ECF transporter S component [Lachnospiraceae bacterium]